MECFKPLNVFEQVCSHLLFNLQQFSANQQLFWEPWEEIACLSLKRNFKFLLCVKFWVSIFGHVGLKHSSQSAKNVSFILQLNVYYTFNCRLNGTFFALWLHCIGLCEKFMFFANDLSPFIRLWVPISWKLGPCWVPKSFSDGAQASLPGDSPLERLFLYVEGSHLAWEGEGRTLAWLSSAGRPVYAVHCTVSYRAPDSINRGKTVTKQPSTADGALIIA